MNSRRIAAATTLGTLFSAAALTAASRIEGSGAARPMNATSHWLHGPAAAARERVDGTHTGIGLATHAAATLFWAVLFDRFAPRRPGGAAIAACATAAVAAAIDYTATPKRFTPGWELALTKRSMAVGYAAMAAGFLAASMVRRQASGRS